MPRFCLFVFFLFQFHRRVDHFSFGMDRLFLNGVVVHAPNSRSRLVDKIYWPEQVSLEWAAGVPAYIRRSERILLYWIFSDRLMRTPAQSVQNRQIWLEIY